MHIAVLLQYSLKDGCGMQQSIFSCWYIAFLSSNSYEFGLMLVISVHMLTLIYIAEEGNQGLSIF